MQGSPVLICNGCEIRIGGHGGASLSNARQQADGTWICSTCRSKGKPRGRASSGGSEQHRLPAASSHATSLASSLSHLSAEGAVWQRASSAPELLSSAAPSLYMPTSSIGVHVSSRASAAISDHPLDPLIAAADAAAADSTPRQLPMSKHMHCTHFACCWA
jgi:hypothetical protein